MRIFNKDWPATKWAPRFGTFARISNGWDEISRGILKISSYPTVNFDIEKPNWAISLAQKEPFNDPGWRLYFHSLAWVGDILLDANGSPDKDETARMVQAAKNLVFSWRQELSTGKALGEEVFSTHGVAIRSGVLVLLWQLEKDEWLQDLLALHAEELLNNFSGTWNHGLVESISLLGLGQELNCDQYISMGEKRIEACLDEMIDEEGATNEQAPGYTGYVWRLAKRAQMVYEAYGLAKGTSKIEDKLNLAETFMLHSLRPDKKFIEIGDSYPVYPGGHPGSVVDAFVNNGSRFEPGMPTKALYKRGYAFSRSSWEADRPLNNNTYVTFRYGPARAVHGHNDHLALTFWSHQREILVDSGHVGYKKGQLRAFMQSHDAHNVIVVRDKPYDSNLGAELKACEIVESGTSGRVGYAHMAAVDNAYDGCRIVREWIAIDEGPLVILDTVESRCEEGVATTQLWHFNPNFVLVQSAENYVRLSDLRGDLNVNLLHFGIEQNRANGVVGIHYWKGADEKLQGWRSVGSRTAIPAPCVGLHQNAKKPQILSIIVPVLIEEEFSWEVEEFDGGFAIMIRIGATKFVMQYNGMNVIGEQLAVTNPV